MIGSNDETENICKKIAKHNNSIKYVFQENTGASGARNYGLELATGEYIAFVDSDDNIECEMYSILISELERENADVACCITRAIDDKGIKFISNFKEKQIFTK